MLLVLFFLQTIITIDKPISDAKYELKLDFEIKRGLFYSKTHSDLSPNGELIVVDRGNKKVRVFNRKGEIVHSFGSEGNGPGEFNSPAGIEAGKHLFYVQDYMKKFIYNYNYELVAEMHVKFSDPRSTLLIAGEFYFLSGNFKNYKKLNIDGAISKLVNLNVKEYDTGAPENSVWMYRYPHHFQPIKNGIVGKYFGDYILEIRDKNFNLTHIIKKNTKAIFHNSEPKVVALGELTVAQKKKIANLKFSRQRIPAINAVIGDTKYGFLVRTTAGGTKTRDLYLDLISHKMEYLAEIKTVFKDRITQMVARNGKIVIDFKNDEIGPYVQVYDLVKVK
jgi:hypothetical protein